MAGQEQSRTGELTVQQVLDAVAGSAAVLDHRGRITAVNRTWCRYAQENGGTPQATGIGVSYLEVCDRAGTSTSGDAEDIGVGDALRSILLGSMTAFTITYPCRSPGREQWFTLRLAPIEGTEVRVLVTHEDVTAHQAKMRTLELRVSQDPLTGLGNRLALAHALTTALAGSPRSGPQGVGLVYIDLDEFKPVNDTHGHAVGDEVLRSVSRRLRTLSRPGDTLARLGGDEFALCAPDMSATGLEGLARRIATELARPHDIRDAALSVPASVGSHLARAGELAEDAMDRADAAMYAVKHRRRGRPTPGWSVPDHAPRHC